MTSLQAATKEAVRTMMSRGMSSITELKARQADILAEYDRLQSDLQQYTQEVNQQLHNLRVINYKIQGKIELLNEQNDTSRTE
jgi:molybdenum-dependent DNA-binding transcriptional regulator ModE